MRPARGSAGDGKPGRVAAAPGRAAGAPGTCLPIGPGATATAWAPATWPRSEDRRALPGGFLLHGCASGIPRPHETMTMPRRAATGGRQFRIRSQDRERFSAAEVVLANGVRAAMRLLRTSDAQALGDFYESVPPQDYRFYRGRPLTRAHADTMAATADRPDSVVLVLVAAPAPEPAPQAPPSGPSPPCGRRRLRLVSVAGRGRPQCLRHLHQTRVPAPRRRHRPDDSAAGDRP